MAPAVEPAGPARRSSRTDRAWMQPRADIDPEATSSAQNHQELSPTLPTHPLGLTYVLDFNYQLGSAARAD